MKKSTKRGLMIAALILILVLAVLVLLRSCGKNSTPAEDDSTPTTPGLTVKPDDAISDSAPEQPDPADILAELNRQVEESMITMSMNPEPIFKSGRDSGSLLIHNDESNRHAQVVQIIRDSEEDIIYTSGAIPVGKYINADKLDVALSAGDYPCTAYFHSVNDAGEILGTGAVHIIVHIQK